MDQRGHTRRQVRKGAIGGAAGIVLGARVAAQAVNGTPEGGPFVRLADDLFVVTIPGETNVVAHTIAGGVLLVDGASAKASDALMKVVAGLPGGGPVHTIFNTHWHPEQTGLNEQIGKAEKTIIAHENTWLWLATDVERAALQAPAEDRAAEQDLLQDRQAGHRSRVRLHPRCRAHRRGYVRVLPQTERARGG